MMKYGFWGLFGSFLLTTTALAADVSPDVGSSASVAVPHLPSSGTADGKEVGNRIENVVRQVNADLTKIHVNTGDLSVPETSENELEKAMKDAQEQRRLRSLTANTIAAGNLVKAQESVVKTQASIQDIARKAGSPENGPTGDVPLSEQSPAGAGGKDRRKAAFDTMMERAKNSEAERKAHLENIRLLQAKRIDDRKTQHDRIMSRVKEVAGASRPVVASIFGPAFAPQASLLIPYMGEKTVSAGDSVTLIDNSQMKIVHIDGKGVTASSGGSRFRLGSGDFVPGRDALDGVIQSVRDEMTRAGAFNDLDLNNGPITSEEEMLFGAGGISETRKQLAPASSVPASLSGRATNMALHPPGTKLPGIEREINGFTKDEGAEGPSLEGGSGRPVPVHQEKNGEEAPPISE